MPYREPPRCVGRICESDSAVRAGLRSPFAVGHIEECGHAIVNVAAKRDHARLVEDYAARLILCEKLEFKALRRGEGINVVPGRIEVGERHFCTDRYDGYEGSKCHVLL